MNHTLNDVGRELGEAHFRFLAERVDHRVRFVVETRYYKGEEEWKQ